VVLGDAIFEPELVEQTALSRCCRPIIAAPPLPLINQLPETPFAASLKLFFDSIGQTVPVRARAQRL
jgi:hypothetical protein